MCSNPLINLTKGQLKLDKKRMTNFLVLQGVQLSGIRFLFRTTLNCSSGECPPEDGVVEEEVGAMMCEQDHANRRVTW